MQPNATRAVLALTQLEVPDQRYQGGGLPKGAVIIGALAGMYILPTLLAFARGSRRRGRIAAINLLLGWTVVGWIAAMVMTFAYEPPAEGDAPDTPRHG